MLCILVVFSLLQLSCSTISCRISCRRCRDKTDHPELVEVYCAMCNECKERRREWLQGPPSLNIRNEEYNYLHPDNQDTDDCIPSNCEDPCDEKPLILAGSTETTIVTTTTTTTTTTRPTTRRPCRPKPKCSKPCAVPMMPMIPMMPMCSPCDVNQISASDVLNDQTRKKSLESINLYLGLPNNLLNELKIGKKED